MSPLQYHPLHHDSYRKFHQFPLNEKGSNVHGNNYLYTQENLRNGVLFTYHDPETNTYLPFTFNTNDPLCLVVPDPYIHAEPSPILIRMLNAYIIAARMNSYQPLPIVIKGVTNKTANKLISFPGCLKITHDPDITTIPAEMNMPALSFNISRLLKMVKTGEYHGQPKKPKVITVVKRLDPLITCEDWKFRSSEAKKLVRQWAQSKFTRLKQQGYTVDKTTYTYLQTSILQTIAKAPPGERNKDYFAIAIRAKETGNERRAGELLGVIVASQNSETVAALNAVVVPVKKGIRDLGYYSVYKMVEYMSHFGIQSYWHGPKESASDVEAVIEFFGKPDKKDKKYCIRWEDKAK